LPGADARVILIRMRYATAFVVLVVACASVDQPPGLSGPTIEVVNDTGALHVIAPDYKMTFAANGIHLPDHLTVNGGELELLGKEDCRENLVGVAVVPAVSVAAGTPIGAQAGAQHVRSDIMALLTGPAVVKIRVTFGVDYLCPVVETVSGTIDFTMFPGGRIVREDIAITPSTTNPLAKHADCGCQQGASSPADLGVLSYWAFEPMHATQVQANGQAVTSGVLAACTMYPELAIGVSWAEQAAGARYHPNATASHVLDWTAGASSLAPTPLSMTSAIQIANTPLEPSDCGRVLALLADVPLQIGDTRLPSTDHDGIYRDPVIHTSAFEVKALDQEVPSGFAISVDLGGADRADLSGQIATVQREAGDRFLIVFRDGLNPGNSFTIEPK
jgi:hypothetical protein